LGVYSVILREHQREAIQQSYDSIRAGKHRPMIGAATAFGKTVVASEICRHGQKNGRRVMFICDRIKLVDQTIEKFGDLDFGVQQGSHELQNGRAPIQIASVKTLMSRNRMPEADLFIVDEAHTHYKYLQDLMTRLDKVPFIGLSATPYSKGLGKYYNNLIVPITPRELEAQGFLCPTKYYGGKHIDISGARSGSLPTGGTDFTQKSLNECYEKGDQKGLIGDITKNWFEKSHNRKTAAFSPSIKTSKWLVDEFNGCGIESIHIDAYTKPEERLEMFDAHENGEVTMLSCSSLLSVGYDYPGLECLIDAYQTKSIIKFVQTAGRLKRIFKGKEFGVYLDHAGNLARFGFPEDIVPESLDDGSKKFSESNQVKEKKPPKVKQCPSCYQEMVGMSCPCGYQVPMRDSMETDGSDLVEIKTAAGKRNNKHSRSDKEKLYGEMLKYCEDKGKKIGYAKHQYKAYYGVWPNNVTPIAVDNIRPETKKWITGQNIRRAKGRS